jgi:hypothetical protein
MIALAIDQHDAVPPRKTLPEGPRGGDAADPSAEDENRLLLRHRVLPSRAPWN